MYLKSSLTYWRASRFLNAVYRKRRNFAENREKYAWQNIASEFERSKVNEAIEHMPQCTKKAHLNRKRDIP